MKLSAALLLTLCWVSSQTAVAWSWGSNNKKNDSTNDNAEPKPEEPSVLGGLSPVSVSAQGIPMVTLHNDLLMPLVGLGVEYLPPYMVPLMTASALQPDKKTYLFDTAHVTGNENMLATGISQGMERLDAKDALEIHVITKVWYTHLGYHRTMISVQESFQTLKESVGLQDPRVTLKLHVLLQWPRCYENIEWMNCELDEATVAPHVQQAGPPPHQDKDNAWKESWKALQDLYLQQTVPVASIGVANFHYKDLKDMDAMEGLTVHPHILQVSVWSLLYDPLLVDYCQERNIHLQIVDAIDGILADPSRAPNAHHHLLKVADDLQAKLEKEGGPAYEELTPVQVILAWLVQQGVSVIPGTERLSELQQNSALTLGSLPTLSNGQVETVAHCLEAFLSGDDLEKDIHAYVTFTAKSKDTMLYWQKPDGTGESKIAFIGKGRSFNETTYPKHHFRIYDARNKDNFIDYHVQARFGEHQTFEAYLD